MLAGEMARVRTCECAWNTQSGSPSGVEEEQGRGDDITDNGDQSVQATSCNFRENQVPGSSECCRERHYTVLEKLLSAVGIPENSKKNADSPEGNRLGTEPVNALCFCCR